MERHKETFRSDLLLNCNYALLGGYAIYAFFYQFFISNDYLFFKLSRPFHLIIVIGSVLLLAASILYLSKMYAIVPLDVMGWCIGLYIISAALRAPSPTIVLGFMLITIMVGTHLYRQHRQVAYLYIVCFGILLIKTLSIQSMNSEALQKFHYVLTDKDFALQKGLLIGIYCVIAYIALSIALNQSQYQLNNTMTNSLKIIVPVIFVCMTVFTIIVMVGKELMMGFATYDKGLFTQMFESMRHGLGPMSSLERDHWMSHFHVHISPIFYFMLPFYMLVPRPETLEVVQVLVTMSGFIPFYLILKHYETPNLLRRLLLILFIVAPTFTSSHLYGLHENCFLTPMLLWLIVANLKQWRLRLLLILCIILMIKEDIMIYIVAIGLYFIFQTIERNTPKRKLFILFSQVIVPIIHFSVCLYYLNTFGDGSMTTRFTNFMMPGQTGLKDVVINIVTNPTYFFSAIFTFSKVKYIVTLLAAFAFLPILQKHLINYVLLLPMLVINLLSDFQYQVDFGFQYHYGSSALLLFMTVLSIQSFLQHGRKSANVLMQRLIFSACIMSTAIMMTFYIPATYGIQSYLTHTDYFQAKKDTLNQIPKDKRILAYGFYTTQLASAQALYDLDYHHEKKVDTSIDYVVVPREMLNQQTEQTQLIKQYIQAGYKENNLSSNDILILKK
ncbi:DUF2079 domain-containing protein [Macrococcus capreoli]|uniref:DUF2079 domain-containing protein n=1 Tax=Macrococcus capreoli TaxID=2982690 RepID=UPI0021D57375|nr:DUF2079 domain-containing protein [Macrococcus sp. TMW 2.2395]MCU7556637.1 DUF2079 domain-containing protein [Macrococcus sp. TMW 2.2395]